MRLKDYAVIATLLVGATTCFQQGLTPTEAVVQPIIVTTPVSLQSPVVIEQRIETIRVGQRMWIGDNPSDERDYSVGADIRDASQWRKMMLRCPKRDGSTAKVEMLRPVTWLNERSVRVGGQVEINVPECSIEGMADVLGLQSCPVIQQGPGRVVTATFHHHASQAIDLAIEGLDEPIGTTANHPIWSETKQQFVRADQLRPGDEVRTANGVALVTSISPRGPPEPVYNLEVQFEHVYRVGKAGVLVHNGGLPILNPCSVPNQHANGRGLGSKAPDQVTPGTTELTGQYIDDVGQVQPWRARYDEFGRQIERTDFTDLPSNAHPNPHHHTREYGPGFGRKGREQVFPGPGPLTGT